MRIAIIGSGISGLVAAHELCLEHDITVFEAGNHIGGHTHTHRISHEGETYAIDTGFIVFNDWTYPRFIKLMDELGVQSQKADMSFSVKCQRTGLEYNGTNFNRLFAQRSNALKPSFWRMLRDIRRFNSDAQALLQHSEQAAMQSLGDFLNTGGYAPELRDHYILPMGAAIWSATRETMLGFPLAFFLKFLNNHGMLSINDRPQWRAIRGGSQSYISPLTKRFKERIHTQTPIEWIRRHASHVEIKPRAAEPLIFDKIILATHSDQALALLKDPHEAEQEILGSLPYQKNSVLLHTDDRILPKKRLAWAAWNYHLLDDPQGRATITYNMNTLQSLAAPVTFCVTLNCDDQIDPAKVIKRLTYHHPIYTTAGVKNQARYGEISGQNHTYYAGAYWFNGFHEDGVHSGQRVAEHIRRGAHA